MKSVVSLIEIAPVTLALEEVRPQKQSITLAPQTQVSVEFSNQACNSSSNASASKTRAARKGARAFVLPITFKAVLLAQ